MSASKFGSALRDRLETSFLRQVGHSLLLQRAVDVKKQGKKEKKSIEALQSFTVKAHSSE